MKKAMKMNRVLLLLILWLSGLVSAQMKHVSSSEIISYRIHYGIINAGMAELAVTEENYKGKPHYHIIGKGNSTGVVNTFFKVRDVYESYIDTGTGLPSFYVRNISEGGYKRHFETTFNHANKSLVLNNKLKKESRSFSITEGLQDMISAFYYLRNLEATKLKVGEQLKLNVWIDDEIYPFLLKIVGVENKETKFGRIECLKIVPSVQSGRVFKNKESVVIWVTNDQNHLPIEIEAKLLIGSLKASINHYSNVKYHLNFNKK